MAQPTIVKQILGAIVVPADTPILNSTIVTAFPTANMTKLKTDGVRVSINSTPWFDGTYDAEDYIANDSTSQKFDKETTLLIGKYVVIT